MNNISMALAVQKQVRPKFRGRQNMLPRVKVHYPHNLERECMRISNTYMAMFSRTLSEHLPKMRKILDAQRQEMRTDDTGEASRMITQAITEAQIAFERSSEAFGLESRLLKVANLARRRSIQEWKRIVHDTLGINILEDYYMGEFFRHTLKQWVTRNVNLITSVPDMTMTRITNIIQNGLLTGRSNASISRQIQWAYGVDRRKAQFWARDQMAKLNSDLAQQQMQDAGVEEYIWQTAGDERVRGNPAGKWPKGDHYELDGTRHSWNNPPIVDMRTGRRAHPGMDYRCRCVALPIFNLPGLNLPWDGGMAA